MTRFNHKKKVFLKDSLGNLIALVKETSAQKWLKTVDRG